MKTQMDVKTGAYSSEGAVIDPASITLTLYELELSEYRSVMAILSKEFNIDYTSQVFRQNRDVIVKGSDSIHDARCPVEGVHTRL